MTSPVSLTGYFFRDMLTSAVVDTSTPMLHKISDSSDQTETNPIIITEDHVLSKEPVVSPMFENIDIVQGSISDDNVEKSINRHHHRAKIWFSAIKRQSAATDKIQLKSFRIIEKLANIKRSGMLIQRCNACPSKPRPSEC